MDDIYLLSQKLHRRKGGVMKEIVGGYELRRLWEELQEYKADDNGIILFNFERWKRVHDIAPDATAPE